MPFNGSGQFSTLYNWQNDAAAGMNISSARMQGQDADMAAGFSNCVTRDGQSPARANLPMGGFRHTGVMDGVADTDYASLGQAKTLIAAGASLAFPIGSIIMWNSVAAPFPSNFQLCDGTNNTPDLRGQFVTGANSPSQAISSITNAGTTATLTTAAAHKLKTGATVTVENAVPAAYNGVFTITVTNSTAFTYTALSNPGGPATVVGDYINEYADGSSGGAARITLTTDQLPAHNHPVVDPMHGHVIPDPGHAHTDAGHDHAQATQTLYNLAGIISSVSGPSGGISAGTRTGVGNAAIQSSFTGITAATAHATGITISNTGSGSAFDARPPWYSLCFIQRMS